MIQYGQKGGTFYDTGKSKGATPEKGNVSRGAGSADSCRTSNCLQMGNGTFSAGRTNTDSDCAGLGSTGFSVLGETIHAEKEEDTLQIMAKKLEEINTCLAERSARTRRRIRTIAIVMILLAFAGIVLLLLFSTGLLHQPPSGPNVIGGADGAAGILIVGTNRFAFGVGMAVCICALIAGGILLHRSKR